MTLTRWTTTIADLMAVTVTVEQDEAGRVVAIDLRAHRPPEWPKERHDMIPWGPVELDAFESLGKVWTINLRGGMPLSECLLPGQRHHPAGLTTDPLIPVCRSPVDYVSRAIEARFILGRVAT